MAAFSGKIVRGNARMALRKVSILKHVTDIDTFPLYIAAYFHFPNRERGKLKSNLKIK
jgi:hypothetical protein